jgi:non-ribosomal peptide synthetase component F
MSGALLVGTVMDLSARTLHGAFELSARAHANRIAVRDSSRCLNYTELNDRASRVAVSLLELGVKPGDLVGVYLDRSVDMVAGVLGILKCGAAFVPLDPEFPAERISMMAQDAHLDCVVTERVHADRVPGNKHLFVDELDEMAPTALPSVHVAGTDTAYVIYTSGSTGKPKGVKIAHESVVNLLMSVAHEPGIVAGDVWLAVTTSCLARLRLSRRAKKCSTGKCWRLHWTGAAPPSCKPHPSRGACCSRPAGKARR